MADSTDKTKVQETKYFGEQNRLRDDYMYTSYSGTDIVAEILVPGESKPLTMGEIQTISYSIHRENKPVRLLGRSSVAGFTKGSRTIAGSLIFTQFNSYAFYKLRQFGQEVYGQRLNKQLYPLADMLPPFDVCLTFANEYGSFSRMRIYGVSIVDEGGTMSIDDLYLEQTFTFMARGIQPLVAYVPETFTVADVGDKTRVAKRNSIGVVIPEVMS